MASPDSEGRARHTITNRGILEGFPHFQPRFRVCHFRACAVLVSSGEFGLAPFPK